MSDIFLEDACAIASRTELELDSLIQPSSIDKAIVILYRAYIHKCERFNDQSNEINQLRADIRQLAEAMIDAHKDQNCGNNKFIDFIIHNRKIKTCPACTVARKYLGGE